MLYNNRIHIILIKMEKEYILKELTTLQCELNNYLRVRINNSEPASRIRYEVSASAMKMIREGEITNKEKLHKIVYRLIDEEISAYTSAKKEET